MNKECIIVNFYPNDFNKVKILYDCLLSLKNLKKDIFLISHFPVDKEIQNICKYCIFDSENETITTQESLENNSSGISNFFTYDNWNIKFANAASKIVTVAILKSLHTVYTLAKGLGYNYAHFFVGDMIISKEDINSFLNISDQVIINNQKAYFEATPFIEDKKYTGIECFYWFSEISWFIDNFLQITNKTDFLNHIKNTNNTYLEIYFYNILTTLSLKDYILYKKNPEDNVISFSKSKKLGLSNNDIEILTNIVWDEQNQNWFFYIKNNSEETLYLKKIAWNENKSVIYENTLLSHHWYTFLIDLHIEDFFSTVVFINNKEIFKLNLDKKLIEKYKKISFIKRN